MNFFTLFEILDTFLYRWIILSLAILSSTLQKVIFSLKLWYVFPERILWFNYHSIAFYVSFRQKNSENLPGIRHYLQCVGPRIRQEFKDNLHAFIPMKTNHFSPKLPTGFFPNKVSIEISLVFVCPILPKTGKCKVFDFYWDLNCLSQKSVVEFHSRRYQPIFFNLLKVSETAKVVFGFLQRNIDRQKLPKLHIRMIRLDNHIGIISKQSSEFLRTESWSPDFWL